MEEAASGTASAAPLEPPQTDLGASGEHGFIDNAAALWNDLRGLAHDHLELAALETKRAGESLVTIVVFGIVTAILVVTAWMGLIAALVLWLMAIDVAPALAMLIGVGVNLAGAGGLVFLIKSRAEALKFPATVRALKPGAHKAAVADMATQ